MVILQLTVIVSATTVLLCLVRKGKRLSGLCLLFVMVFSASRGYGFHGLAAWYLAVMIIILYYETLSDILIRVNKMFAVVLTVMLMSTYITAAGNNILAAQPVISEIESRVIELTEDADRKDIYIDAYCCDSLYLIYKGRNPVNPAAYMLPWYMDWYEGDNIQALLEKKPELAVYNEDRETWGYTHYTVAFDNELTGHYTRLGDKGWKHSIWIRKEEGTE